MRLGLVLAEIGERNSIQVSDDELSRDIVERTRQFPGREQEIWDYYRKNPSALASVRAPLFEEKVVDFILELAKVTDKPVPFFSSVGLSKLGRCCRGSLRSVTAATTRATT